MPRPAPVGGGGRDDLLSAIRGGGGGLKKATDRVLPEPSGPVDSQSQLLNEIRNGRQLKKVVIPTEKPKPSAPQLGGVSIGAILARRAALEDSDSESDDDDEWND